jgi:hypothetical protein
MVWVIQLGLNVWRKGSAVGTQVVGAQPVTNWRPAGRRPHK